MQTPTDLEQSPKRGARDEASVSLPPTRDRDEIIRRMRAMCGNAANEMGLFTVDWTEIDRRIEAAVDAHLAG